MRLNEFLIQFRLVRRVRSAVRRLIRRIRYGRMPADGWGQGWRVLVFRYRDHSRDEVHVLAPVKGASFDWEVLRLHVNGEPWPEFAFEGGKLRGTIGWAGHHTYLMTDHDPPQRLSMGELVPGEFRGGVERTLLLVSVRDANL